MKQLKGIKKSIVLLGGDKEPTLEVFYRHDPSCFSSSFIFFNFYLQVVVSSISQNASLHPRATCPDLQLSAILGGAGGGENVDSCMTHISKIVRLKRGDIFGTPPLFLHCCCIE